MDSVFRILACVFVFGAGAACSGAKPSAKKIPVKPSLPDAGKILSNVLTQDPNLVTVTPFNDKEALQLLKDTCEECHGMNKPTATNFRSYWPMPVEFSLAQKKETDPKDFDRLLADPAEVLKLKSKLESDQFAANAYQSILNTVSNKPTAEPPPMPATDNISSESIQKLKRLAAWFESTLPAVASEASIKYHGSASISGLVNLNMKFTCTKPATFRTYLNRVTQEALGRPPNVTEVKWAENPDTPVSVEQRELIRQKLAKEWKEEFKLYGLRRFAEKISGVQEIDSARFVEDPQFKADVKEEFYQHVLDAYDKGESYTDVLLSNKVFVTAKTAPYYGCPVPVAPKKWEACEMKAPRGSFFTTLGFLMSKQSSFLTENNNYGRVAVMNEVIYGEALKPNTQGETGTVNPLPQCLKTNDFRGLQDSAGSIAPRGSAKIPVTGNLCQSCHIQRYLAAGSIAFRPFGGIGELVDAATLRDKTKQSTFTVEFLKKATNQDPNEVWVNQKPDGPVDRVTLDFIVGLLNIGESENQEQGCIPAKGEKPEIRITQVKELAQYMIGDGVSLAKGLSRLLPRGLSNLSSTNRDVMSSISDAWQKGGGKLEPVFQAYFSTETFACEVQE